jgi:hypothetical protein
MYWYTSGTQINFSIDSRSKNYDCIIPLSAVHEESGVTFVYAMKTQSSPLGDAISPLRLSYRSLAGFFQRRHRSFGAGLIRFRRHHRIHDKSFKSGDQVRLVEGL